MSPTIHSSLQTRDHVVDFTKGAMVIAMVAYHSLNYFLPTHDRLFAYLSFVTWGFIFYAGFVCGTIYFKKFIADRGAVYRRLVVRGLKLLLLYVFVNALLYVFIAREENYFRASESTVYDILVSIFLSGESHAARFNVLLPIAYTLLIAAPLIGLHRFKYSAFALVISVFTLLSVTDLGSHNLRCVLTGTLGLFAGLIHNELHPMLYAKPIRYLGGVLLALFLSLNPQDPRNSLLVFVLYIVLMVYNLQSLALLTTPFKGVGRNVDMLGQYSLILYIAQIAILQCIRRVWTGSSSVEIRSVLIFVFVNVCLLVFCYSADYLRKNVPRVDRAYRFVFS